MKYYNFLILFLKTSVRYQLKKEWVKACCLITCCLLNLKTISSCKIKHISQKANPQAKRWCDGIWILQLPFALFTDTDNASGRNRIWGNSTWACREQKNLKYADQWGAAATPHNHLHLREFLKNPEQILVLFLLQQYSTKMVAQQLYIDLAMFLWHAPINSRRAMDTSFQHLTSSKMMTVSSPSFSRIIKKISYT